MDKHIKNKKNQWSKPELIVLVRGAPEEAVLAACKMSTTVTGGGNQACKATGKPCIARNLATS
jgi:hypothetical protein